VNEPRFPRHGESPPDSDSPDGDWPDREWPDRDWPERDLADRQRRERYERLVADAAVRRQDVPDETTAAPPERDAPELPSPPTSDAPVGTRWSPALGDRRRPTTAEEAVPWLIGIILLLTGVVIFLVVLIFQMENPGLVGLESPTPSATPDQSPVDVASPTATPSGSPAASASPTPTPPPAFGELEMVYLGRSSGFGSSSAYRNDFALEGSPTRVASVAPGIGWLMWAPDGSAGAVITTSGRLVEVVAGQAGSALADGIDTATFGPDAKTIYAARIRSSGGTDTAEILAIAFDTGTAEAVTSLTFPTPVTYLESPLKEAQFADEGGYSRLFLIDDDTLVLWVLAGGTWHIDPADGSSQRINEMPVLESVDGRRIEKTEHVTSTTLTVIEADGDRGAQTTVVGLVSHLRWSPDGTKVCFTLGRSGASGGTRQDLWVWEVDGGESPSPLTENGATFGAEWLGTRQSWSS